MRNSHAQAHCLHGFRPFVKIVENGRDIPPGSSEDCGLDLLAEYWCLQFSNNVGYQPRVELDANFKNRDLLRGGLAQCNHIIYDQFIFSTVGKKENDIIRNIKRLSAMFDAGYEAVLLICPDSKIGITNCKEKEGWAAVETIISDFEMARTEPHFDGIYAYFCKYHQIS